MIIRVQGARETSQNIYYEYDNASAPLGQGGMGTVYEGICRSEVDYTQQIPVAIKLITNTSKDLIERAMREAAVAIVHPNLLRMYGFVANMEYNSFSSAYQPRYYLVMEKLDGVNLDQVLLGNTMARTGENVDYASQLMSMPRIDMINELFPKIMTGVIALHNNGYIHRDLDPSNVMITKDGGVKIIDFGISKRIGMVQAQGGTQAGQMMGKVDYAAPELISGEVNRHDQTTDIYSLGIMLYQLTVGTLPFAGDNVTIMQSQMMRPVPVENIYDPRLRKIIEKATQKRQEDRYQNVDLMMQDFLCGDPLPHVGGPGIPVWLIVVSCCVFFIALGVLLAILS